jgi:ankyrin repeat protein
MPQDISKLESQWIERELSAGEPSPTLRAHLQSQGWYAFEFSLHAEAKRGNLPMMKRLLDTLSKNEMDVRHFAGPALIAAARGNNYDAVSLLLEAGANVNAKSNGGTPLLMASLKGRTTIIGLLLNKGADVGATDVEGSTALMKAAINGRTEAGRMLIENGIDIDAKNNAGRTALMMAEHFGHPEFVKMLIDAGAAPHASGETWSLNRGTYIQQQNFVEANAVLEQERNRRSAPLTAVPFFEAIATEKKKPAPGAKEKPRGYFPMMN